MAEHISIRLPSRVAETIKRRGLDPEVFVLEAVVERLSSDPVEELEARLEIADHMLHRAREELERGDPVQASEKLYKAVEECIKVLTCLDNLEECRKAATEGQWWTRLLARAASKLARRHKEPLILEAWSLGYDLHVHGFHEHALTTEDVEIRLPVIEKLVEYTKQALRKRENRPRE